MVTPTSKPRRRPAAAAPLPAHELDAMLDAMDPPRPVSAPPANVAPDVQDWRMGIPEGVPMIHTLIGRIMRDVGPVAKTGYNEQQRYNFRGIDEVTNAVSAAFTRHSVYPTSRILNANYRDALTTGGKPTREVTFEIQYRFTAPDGTYITTEVPGEALDQSDKGAPKAFSVGLRIALLQMLLLPTSEPTTDHDYLTRDGVGSMSATVANLIYRSLMSDGVTTRQVVEEFWPVVLEHSAADRPVPMEASTTWLQRFADRFAHDILAVTTLTEGKALLDILEPAGALAWRIGDKTLDTIAAERATEIRDLWKNTFDHVMGHIVASADQVALDAAIECGRAAVEAGTLPASALDKLLPVAEDRRPKLPEVTREPDRDAHDIPTTPPDEPAAHPYPTGQQAQEGTDPGHRREAEEFAATTGTTADLDAFRTLAQAAPMAGLGEEPSIRQDAVEAAIMDLLSGEFSTMPASNFGGYGFQLVADAIAAAASREKAIGNVVRGKLEKALGEHIGLATGPA